MRAVVDKLLCHDSNGEALNYKEIFGTSADTKPTTGVATGSLFVEVDTGDAYLFNETTSAWVKQ